VGIRGQRLAMTGVVALVAIGPALCVLALRLPLVNQLDYADAWFYSGYAWVPKHHFAVFGWTYFSVRFPAILSIGLFERAFGTHAGYVLLRYLLAVGSGAAVYFCVRRFARVLPSLAASLLLYLNPFFSRMLLWDYSGFFAVAAGVAGFALWWWSDGRRLGWTLLAGTALGAAVFANPVVATAVLVLVVVEALAAARRGRKAAVSLAYRFAVAAGGAAAVFFAGYLSYRTIVPSAHIDDLVRPTIDFLRSNSENSAPYQRPASEFLLHELRIWPPVVSSVALIAVLRREVLSTDVPARIAQACIAYVVFLWVYRFTVTSSVIETWWAYDFVIVFMAPAVGVLLYGLGRHPRGQRLWAIVALGTATAGALVIRTASGTGVDAYRYIADHAVLIYLLVGVGLAAAVSISVRNTFARLAGSFLLVATLTVMLWAPSVFDGRGTTGIFVTDGGTEWRVYPAARQFINLVRDYDAPQSRVYTWYSATHGPTSIGWTTLPQEGQTVQELGLSTRLDRLEPLGRARLQQPDAAYVMVLSTRSVELRAAEHALDAGGFRDRLVRQGALGSSGIRYVLMRLTKKP
jgi:hypothetical protein